MPRYTQVIRACENHPERPAVEDEYPPVTVGAGAPRVFDACEECDELLVQPFFALVAKGSPVKESLPTKTHKCGWCDYSGPTRQALGTHVRVKHQKGLKEMEEEGTTVA